MKKLQAYEIQYHKGTPYIEPMNVCSNADILGISIQAEFDRLQALTGQRLTLGLVFPEDGLVDLTPTVLTLDQITL